jgi:hypothetical protein
VTSPTLINAGKTRRLSAARLAASGLIVPLLFSAPLFAQAGSATFATNPEARPPSVRLVLEAGPETATCLSAAELVQGAEAQLGRPAFAETGAHAETLVRVQLERTPEGFRARVALENAEKAPQPGAAALAARELETREDCRSLDEPLVLVVALLADSGGETTAHHEEAPPPEPPPPEPPAEAGPISTAPGWEQARRGPWTFALDAGLVAAFGVMPDVAFGVEVGAGFSPPGWPLLRARVLGFLPGRAELEPSGRLDFLVGMAGLGVCPELLAAARVSLQACFGGDMIVRRADSHGLEGGQTTTRVTTQGTLGLRAGFGLGEGWLTTGGIGAGLLSHIDRFSYRRNGELELAFAPAFVPIFASLGISHEFR